MTATKDGDSLSPAPTNTLSELDGILQNVYAEAYKCGVGAKHPYRYRSLDAVVADAKAALTTHISKEVAGARIKELKRLDGMTSVDAESLQTYINTRIAAITSEEDKDNETPNKVDIDQQQVNGIKELK